MDLKYILAIDLGTSGPKVGLYSTRGELLGYEFEPTPLILLPNGGAEQRPDDWWAAIVAATRRLVGRRLAPVDEIVAACVTAQWSGTVAVDRDGRPLMNAIIWLDSRGAEDIRRAVGGRVRLEGYGLSKLATWIRLCGGAPARSGKDPIAHILYLRRAFPEIYRAAYQFLEPKDYLNLRLTGLFAASYDSIALHWLTDNRDLSRVRYDPRLLALAGVSAEQFPPLRRAVDVLGPLRPEVATEMGLHPGVQVVMGTPDVHSAALGSGAVADGQGHLYLGTSAWISAHVPFKKTDLFANMASLPSAIPDRYLVANDQETAGGCLNFLRDRVFWPQDGLSAEPPPPDAYQAFDRLAATAPAGSGQVLFTPWLFGERTPVEDPYLRGGFFNLSLQADRACLVRAVLEGVAFNARWLLGAVDKFVHHRLDPLNIIGGGANSPLWCQIHADVLGRTIRQVKDPSCANLRGAAFLASVALGYLSWDEISGCTQIAAEFAPNPTNRAVYDELFRSFVGIYKDNRRAFHRLNAADS